MDPLIVSDTSDSSNECILTIQGMNPTDASLVYQLYQNDYIQVLVVTVDLCWSLQVSSHLVLILGLILSFLSF